MRRTALIVLAVAGGLCALVLIAVAIAVATVDLRTLVEPLLARVKAATGRDVAITGPIDLEFSLQPRIVLNGVTLGNAPWSASKEMASVRRVEARVGLLPLLQRRFEIVEIALTEPRIALETDAQGRGNWEFGTPASPASPPAASAAGAAGALAIGLLSVENGSVTYRGAADAKPVRIGIEQLRIRSRGGDAPVDAEFRGSADDVAVALTGSLGPLDALRAGRWPVALAAKGQIEQQPAALMAMFSVRPDAIALDDLDVTLGGFKAKGQVSVLTAGKRRKYVFDLALPATALQDLALPVAARTGATRSAPRNAESRYVFSETPLPLAALRAYDASGQLSIAELRLGDRVKVAPLSLHVALDNGRLELSRVSFGVFGGTAAGGATLDASRGDTAALTLKLDSRDLDAGAILAAAGTPRQTRGGKTTLAVDIRASGASPRAWASTASGTVTTVVGPMTLVNTRLDLGNVLDRLAQAVNPFREVDASTELECAVIRLPLAAGVARIDRSIGMETKKVGVSVSGTVDFRSETLDLSLRPHVRAGIALDLPKIAELVRYAGPFTDPRVTIDAVASAETIAKIGAAIGTGGLSVLGTTLLRAAQNENACDVALGRKAPPATADKAAVPAKPAADPAAALPREVGKALGKLFGR